MIEIIIRFNYESSISFNESESFKKLSNTSPLHSIFHGI